MSKFSQIVKKQRAEKVVPIESHDDVAISTGEENLSPVQRRAAAGTQYGTTLKRLDVDLIDLSPYQPRLVAALDDQELKDLADNIRQYGQINPIVVRPKNGRYELVGGERRLRAIRDILALKNIDCLIKDITDEKAALTALVDNINRSDLSDYEIAYALTQTCDQFGYPLDNIDFVMEKFNISRNKYYRLISLFDLPSFISDDLKKVPQALSGSGASLLKTALNRANDQIGSQHALILLEGEWKNYFAAEFSKNQKRNTQFIKNFEQQVQAIFVGKTAPHEEVVSPSQKVQPLEEASGDKKPVEQLGLFNTTGKKIGSLKCTESLKGKTVLSIRVNVDNFDDDKLEKVKQFLQTLES